MLPTHPAPIAPPTPAERAIITRVVDPAPPLRPAVVAELSALFTGGAS